VAKRFFSKCRFKNFVGSHSSFYKFHVELHAHAFFNNLTNFTVQWPEWTQGFTYSQYNTETSCSWGEVRNSFKNEWFIIPIACVCNLTLYQLWNFMIKCHIFYMASCPWERN
jgi:hypothetical protein